MFLEKKQAGIYQFSVAETVCKSGVIRAEVNACENPVCRCEEVEIGFFDGDQFFGEVSAHVYDERLLPPSKKLNNAVDSNLTQVLRASLQKEDWTCLREDYLRIKRQATDEIDTVTVQAPFPMAKDIERHSELVPFTAILPYAEAFLKIEGDEVLLFDDQYCLQPDCDCTRAFASFIVLKDLKQVTGEPPGIFIDYETGKLDVEFEGEPAQDVRALFEKVQQNQQGLLAKLRRRHKTLKALYANFRLSQAPESIAKPKVGRNEPCLCGSGKKFKKCCGAIVEA